MSERVRGALFNTLGELDGMSVLDAFAGSGALSFEAVSRGAEYVTAIEIDKTAQKAIERTTQELRLKDKIKLVRANCSSWSSNNPDIKFDIVIAAPPYDDLQLKVVEKLSEHLSPGGIFVLDWPGHLPLPVIVSLELVTHKDYGDAQLAFYKR